MPLIPVTALRPFPYKQRTIKVGESVHVAPIEAASLVYQRKAKLSVVLRPRKPSAPETDPAPVTRVRQSYKRRDLKAEE